MKSIWSIYLCAGLLATMPLAAQREFRPRIPKSWDDKKLVDWATPLAGINVRPTHISEKEYYSLPVDNLKTYPVYFPGREPAGYWEMLQKIGPKPLIEPSKLKTEADWLEAGREVFAGADHIHQRSYDERLIALVRNAKVFQDLKVEPLTDGTLPDVLWVPTEKGVALSAPSCASCHTFFTPKGEAFHGAPYGGGRMFRPSPLAPQLHLSNRLVNASSPFFMGQAQPIGEWLYQAWSVPWRKDDIHQRLKTVTAKEYEEMRRWYGRSFGLPRWNGSIFHPHKTPDLVGIQERKYIDATATHLHRDIGDLMRYAALVSVSEPSEFGVHKVLAPDTVRVKARRSDEALYALALYLYSLKPPPNPNSMNEKAQAGKAIFSRSGCAACHTPPFYTNNKLTLAEGFTPPANLPKTLDVLRVSVGTDHGLALETRKGTGYYKIPSLKGVWYRGRYLHHGAVATLEELFNPERVKESFVPGGWRPFGSQSYAIKGHEFGLALSAAEREKLIAFLRTL
jgi:hypothetical protein